ncbi:hypothetical protein DL98DRAFT_275725 [Cadophora sp. DSE1049]|nr:hypothetical protein DL98DRAFT_275725 [Cadophora sp. DSE1049]
MIVRADEVFLIISNTSGVRMHVVVDVLISVGQNENFEGHVQTPDAGAPGLGLLSPWSIIFPGKVNKMSRKFVLMTMVGMAVVISLVLVPTSLDNCIFPGPSLIELVRNHPSLNPHFNAMLVLIHRYHYLPTTSSVDISADRPLQCY